MLLKILKIIFRKREDDKNTTFVCKSFDGSKSFSERQDPREKFPSDNINYV